MIWISLKTAYLKPILIIVIYRPPSGNIVNFIETINNSIENLDHLHNNEVFVLGDVNLDMLNKKDKYITLFKKKMSRHNLLQLIKQPTRYNTTNKGSLLDLCFSSSTNITQSGVGSWNLSDHELIYVTRKHKTNTKIKTTFEGRTYRNYDQINLQNEIRNLEWNYFFTIKNPDLACNYLLNKVMSIIDRYCPSKKYNIKNLKDPWITNELLEMIHDKDYFLAKAKKHGKNDDWRIARNLRNQTKSLVKNAKIVFIKEQLEPNKSDSKKFWRNIKTIIPDASTNKQIHLNYENNSAISEKDTSSYINEFFTSIGPLLARKDTSNYTYQVAGSKVFLRF